MVLDFSQRVFIFHRMRSLNNFFFFLFLFVSPLKIKEKFETFTSDN